MKNAIVLHGTGGTPDLFWFPYIRKHLESLGYNVWAPQLPNKDSPSLDKNLPFVLDNSEINEETIIVGHSSGCPLILSILENIGTKIKKAILVAGFYKSLDSKPNPILQEKYNWEKIKSNVGELIFINSDNDPWGCDDKMGREMFENLGGTLIIRHGEGHMGSEKFNQPYKEFPLLRQLLTEK